MNCHAMEEKGSSFDIAANLISEKKINLDGMITHRFPLGEYKEAIKTFLSKSRSRAIKIVIDHQQ